MLGIEDITFFFEQKRRRRFLQRRVRKLDDTHSLAGERKEGVTFRVVDKDGDTASVAGGPAPSVRSTASRVVFPPTGSLSRRSTLAVLPSFLPSVDPSSRKVSVAEPTFLDPSSRRVSVVDPTFNSRKSTVAEPTLLGRRISVVDPPTHLPPVDPSGPRLTTTHSNIPEETVETRSVTSEKKLLFLQEVEAKLDSRKGFRSRIWSLNEAKFASTGILSKLSKTLEALDDQEEDITLPEDLVETLSRTHEHLIADAVVERREWQTDCYLDYKSKNVHPFLTSVPEPSEQLLNTEAIKHQQRQQQKSHDQPGSTKVEKRVRMSREAKNVDSSHDRPQTARSIMSNFSLKSDGSDDGRDSTITTDYDRLPAELRPNILHYHRGNNMAAKTTPRTRMEKAQRQAQEMKEELMKKAMRKDMLVVKSMRRLSSITPKKLGARPPSAKQGARSRPSSAKPPKLDPEFLLANQPKTVIAFSVEDTAKDTQDWLVHPSDSKDLEAHTLRMWDRKLKELHRMREESEFMDLKREANKPMMVKFYNESQLRTQRAKHQRSATVPLPSFLSKLPPSMGSFAHTPTASDAVLMIGEGGNVFVLTLPDGSGYCKYISGRQAISQSRCDDERGPLHGSKGLYTLVFDDVDRSTMLAYFTPTGKACCYYQSGAIRMISDRKGGCLYSEEGVVTRKWEWPPPNLNMPVSVSLYLNVHISLRSTGLTNMVLRVSTRGHSYKFSVGPTLGDLELVHDTEDLAGGDLQCSVPFYSRAAKSHDRYLSVGGDDSGAQRKLLRNKSKSYKSFFADEGSQVSQASQATKPSTNLEVEGEKYSGELETFKTNIRNIVNNWTQHYCRAIGIAPPLGSSLFSRPTSRAGLHSRGVSSRGRLVKSSMGYVAGSRPSSSSHQLRRTRSLTHPLGSGLSSRAGSPPVPFKYLSTGEVEAHSPTPASPFRPASTLDHLQPPSTVELHSKPFLAGSARSPSKSAGRAAVGCPVSLHHMFCKSLDTMPPCKCDKRHVPFITDLVYDVFLLSHVPKDQLVIICATSSLKERSCPCEPMIDAIYTQKNKLRFSPCMQSSRDSFRLIKYDMAAATLGMKEGKDTPLLVERHNASPGMFLMYMGGKLVFADYLFNGYSTSRKDFTKQIEICTQKGKQNIFMPYDFKFTQRTGTKVMGSNTWAYPVSGFMQDLIPFSPQSSSRSASVSSACRDPRVSLIVTESDDVETVRDDSMSTSQLTLSLTTSQLKVSQTVI